MELKLRYDAPAPDSIEGWEQWSLPIGNSHMGGNVFGGVERERIQITENSTENPKEQGGLNSFGEIYIHFPHTEARAENYERGLDLNRALAYTRYDCDGVHVEREVFASYPDRVLAGRVRTSQPLSYEFEVQIPYLTEEEGREKRGTVTASGNGITMAGMMSGFRLRFEGQLWVSSDGAVTAENGRLRVAGATDTRFIFCGATNYELRPEVFLEEDNHKKLRDFDPHGTVCAILEAARGYSYEELQARHEADYRALFGRVTLELGDTALPEATTDALVRAYAEGEKSRYLETLYFHYGRYLLISSSRPGCLPANLQGVWNAHDSSPWGAGYWHNINVQMNYWPAFVTNLAETFQAYQAFFEAFRPKAELLASAYIKETVPENYTDEPGECGWTIGTESYPYRISAPGAHSGPGTCGLTSKLFWDAYAFSGDKGILKEVAYPVLLSVAKHLLRVVRNYDGLWLSAFSASPEQLIDNTWRKKNPLYYHTVGCGFDQQMIWENGSDLLKCVDLIGEENLPEKDLPVIRTLREQIGCYDPVQVGWSGQIKEYREENFYGEVGEFRHRHISQLVGLYPGTAINSATPAWIDAAKTSLRNRGDQSTGWAMSHRMEAWARTGDGNRAYGLFGNLLSLKTLPNLWDNHPPFQIDGNFGGTAGVAEMLLQSHEGFLAPLPALPDAWPEGAYTGLVARGGFEVDVRWSRGCAETITVRSRAGSLCRVKYRGIAGAKTDFPFTVIDGDTVEFATETGGCYAFTQIPAWEKKPGPKALRADRSLHLTWEYEGPVHIWRAVNSEPGYERIASSVTGGEFTDRELRFDTVETVTYKITAADREDSFGDGAWVTLNHSTQLQRQRYRYLITQLNNICGGVEQPEYLGE